MTRRIYEQEMLMKLSKECHQRAVNKGFWDEVHSVPHYLMLVFSEICEAVEADRIGKWAKLTPEQIEKLRGLDGAAYAQAFLRLVKDAVEDEIADAVIRLLDLLGHWIDGGELQSWHVNCLNSVYGEDGIPHMLTDALMPIVATLCDADANCDTTNGILYAIKSLEQLCDRLGIDLMSHIELKMKYNEMRSALHGKKY